MLIVAIGSVLWLLRQSETTPRDAEQRTAAAGTDSQTGDKDVAGTTSDTVKLSPSELQQPSDSPESQAESTAPPTDLQEDPRSSNELASAWEPGAFNRREGGYTLVVSSQATRREAAAFARNVIQGLGDEALKVDILEGTARGRSRYRVGVGQFPSVEQALSEMDRLSPRLPEGVWVLRIRSNM